MLTVLFLVEKIKRFKLFSRLSQSRSHGFLVWCGRTRHELSLVRSLALRAHCRATRSKARLVSKSTILQVTESAFFPRSHGFLVWCGRTRHELSLVRSLALRAHCRATRSKARLVSKSTILQVTESAFFPRMKNLHTKKTSNGSNFGWLIRQMSINQKSGWAEDVL